MPQLQAVKATTTAKVLGLLAESLPSLTLTLGVGFTGDLGQECQQIPSREFLSPLRRVEKQHCLLLLALNFIIMSTDRC
jgi:hypothetical protein